ncbi:MAG TPA: hypothetical protein VHT91_14490 [Kofleriaceae bacterium]|jgi:hypothetical protein|nr:hypothetical protein [Kofleriaceae bacterium]
MIRSLRFVTFVVVAAAAIVPASPALARATKVALCRITGDTAGLGKTVAGALQEGELEVVAGKQVSRAIGRLGLTRALGERDLAKLADELEVDAVVKGALDRRGHRLRFTVFAGGKQGKPFTVQVGNAGSDKFRQAVRTAIEARVAQAVPKRRARSEAEDDAAADDATPAKARTRARKDDDTPADDPPAKRKATTQAADSGDEPPRPGKPSPAGDAAPAAAGPRIAARDADDPAPSVHAQAELAAPAPAHTANLAALRLDLGGSMAGRSLTFDTRSFDGSPRSYQNAPVPGVRVGGELYPIALFAPTSWLAGLGVAADYDRTLSLILRATNEMTVPIAVAEQRYAFGVRYRLAFGHRPTSPTLTLGAGYGARRFVADRSGLQSASSLDLPDVDYRMFDPGVAFRLPLGGHVAVTLAGQGLVVTSAGPIQRTDQYGTARVIGGSASAGVELVISERLMIRIAAEATQLSLSFTGNGTLATSRDGDPSSIDVRGATDRYYGGVATAAVTY